VFSQVIAYSGNHFAGRAPQTLRDFFDTKTFPGPRALRRSSAKYNLEMALLADGVSPADIYAVLSTQAGVRRALNKLGSIADTIVWWTQTSEPVDMLVHGRAVLATVLNGDAFDAQDQKENIHVIWDHQLYELDVFGVPRGDHRRSRGLDFIRYATRSLPLAHTAEWVPYGPARRSSLALVGTNPESGISMEHHLPTAPQNFATAFAIDDSWWLTHGAVIDPQWEAWLNHQELTSTKSH
jgi:putative spermidine/putrescine transport system substrate-binding protein